MVPLNGCHGFTIRWDPKATLQRLGGFASPGDLGRSEMDRGTVDLGGVLGTQQAGPVVFQICLICTPTWG